MRGCLVGVMNGDTATDWTEEELLLRERLERGETTPVHLRNHPRLVEWAKMRDQFTRIDRRTRWGNPYRIRKSCNRAAVIEKYRRYIEDKSELRDRLPDIAGHALGCWCAPKPCHGDVLVELTRGLGWKS